MGLVVPAWVEENAARERFVDDQIMLGIYWSREAAEFDPRASVVFINENAHALMVEDGTVEKVAIPGVEPGRWHIRIAQPPPFANVYMPITGPDGEYREPGSQDIEELKRRSTHNRTVGELLDTRRKDEDRRERERRLQMEQMRDEVAADIQAAQRVMGDGGMTRRRFGRR